MVIVPSIYEGESLEVPLLCADTGIADADIFIGYEFVVFCFYINNR